MSEQQESQQSSAQDFKCVRNGVVVYTASSICQFAESLPWWNITEGGVQGQSSKLLGIRIERSERTGELLNSRTIITKLYDSTSKGTADSRRKMLDDAINSNPQIGVIVRGNHQDLEEKLPDGEVFALMGFWRITAKFVDNSRDAKQQIVRTYMIRLDKIEKTDIWWRSAKKISESIEASEVSQPNTAKCNACGATSYIILKDRSQFLCSDLDCTSNTNVVDPVIIDPQEFEYDEAFLKWRPPMTSVAAQPQYLPPPISMPQSKQELDAILHANKTAKAMWSGYMCQSCNHFNQRTHVANAECRVCKRVQNLPPPLLTFEEVSDAAFLNITDSTVVPKVETQMQTTEQPKETHNDYVVRKWKLHEDLDGYVMVLYPKKHLTDSVKGPKHVYNTLIQHLVNGELNYRRLPTKSRVQGQLTGWFGQNIGKEYGTRMKSLETNIKLEEAKPIHREIVDYLKDTVGEFTKERPEFNEVLAMCYYPNMSMGWHADGEQSIIGDAVASQSLGSTATMIFGVSEKTWVGKNAQNQIDTAVPIFSNCPKAAERRELKAKAERGEITAAQHLEQLKTLLQGLTAPREPKICLRFQLPSGAVMVQKGTAINQFFKHKIEFAGPGSRLRFVNTARYLSDPPQMAGAKRPADDNDDDDNGNADSTSKAAVTKKVKAK